MSLQALRLCRSVCAHTLTCTASTLLTPSYLCFHFQSPDARPELSLPLDEPIYWKTLFFAPENTTGVSVNTVVPDGSLTQNQIELNTI